MPLWRRGRIKSCSYAIVNNDWHGLAYSLLQQKECPCSSKRTASRGRGCCRSMCRPRVFATMSVFARRTFARCLRAPTCLRDDACLRDDTCLHRTCLWEVSSRAHVSSVFARPIFGTCLRTPMHVCSRRRVALPDLSSGNVFVHPRVFARPRVFVTPRAFARAVFCKCLLTCTWLHSGTCLCQGSALRKCLRTAMCLRSGKSLCRECVFKRQRIFAVFVYHVSADAFVSSQTVLCNLSLDPMCLQHLSTVVRRYVHPTRPQRKMGRTRGPLVEQTLPNLQAHCMGTKGKKCMSIAVVQAQEENT